MEAEFTDRAELTTALRHLLPGHQQDAAPLVAGAAMLALDVAVERWQEREGRDELAALIRQAFTTLEQLGRLN